MSLEKWLVAPGQTKIIDVELVRKLKVGLIGGTVDIIGHDEPGARIEVHGVTGKDLKISMDGDRLEIDHPQLRWDNFIEVFASFRGTARAELSISVPRDVALRFGVVSAEALVSGLRNDAKLSTISGDLVVDDVEGDLELNAVNGEISVRNHVGALVVHTVAGDLTASGNICQFTFDGVSSNVFLDLTGTPDRIVTNSVSGNLTVRLDPGLAARYHLNTISGTLQLDENRVRTAFGKSYEGFTGALDGSWVDVRSNSVSGDISVVRRETTSPAPASAASTSAASTSAASISAAAAAAPASAEANAPQDPA